MPDPFETPPHNASETEFEAADFEVPADSTVDIPEKTQPAPQYVAFDELTLTEVVGEWVRSPIKTTRALWAVLRDDRAVEKHFVKSDDPVILEKTDTPPINPNDDASNDVSATTDASGWRRYAQIALYIVAILIALFGNQILAGGSNARAESAELMAGAPFLGLGLAVWLLAELIGRWSAIVAWSREVTSYSQAVMAIRAFPVLIFIVGLWRLLDSTDESTERVFDVAASGIQLVIAAILLWVLIDGVLTLLRSVARRSPETLPRWLVDGLLKNDQSHQPVDLDISFHPVRLVLFGAGLVLIALTWQGTTGNRFDTFTFYAWLGSAACVSLALAPRGFSVMRWVRGWYGRIRQFRLTRHSGVIVAMLLIIAVGAYFRFDRLTGNAAMGTAIPAEMTSDHVEKILDAGRVRDGARIIFFSNNGGREPFQMYAAALFSYLPGQSIGFDSLKILAALESLITLPILFWMGREIVGTERKRLATLTGLLVAGLVAVSYWDVAITRLALRIILTPLVTALILIYLTRAIRRNTRADFIKVGLLLGFGLYTYQAIRMIPVVIVMVTAIAIYFYATRTRDRYRYILNLSVLVTVSFVVFVPMFHFSVENPEEFWRRTTGRLLGDDVIETVDTEGNLIYREATLSERVEAFNENVPVLMSNIRTVLLMFNWKGDVAWINGYPNQPALDPITGALLIVGLGAWGVLMLRRRDPMQVVVPVILFIMLLPSALSIAYPIENPSHTRTSGAIPIVYLLAAFPLALVIDRLLSVPAKAIGRGVSIVLVVGVLGGSYAANTDTYFNKFPTTYLSPSLPYSEAGQMLQGFVLSGGTYGNAYMIAYPYWWDHRALGLAGGLETEWPNGVFDAVVGDDLMRAIDYLPLFMVDAYNRTGRYRYDPTRDLMIFYANEDQETATQLGEWFPNGYETVVQTYQAGDDYRVYRVPALGADGYAEFRALTNTQ